ncbi:c-type cytochrome domain-containing protein [Lacibacter sp. H375]|uniref:c-type cytochrome domain-containing protein n=1 Tax=Lacibacter sp. H375 TaxID=3133424 RepID=UPI0030BD8A70
MLLTVSEFLGRFHPVLVHLPIGILLIAAVFYVLSMREQYKALQQATTVALLLGMLSAVGSCISGYLLSISGDYEADIVSTHKWMGFAVAAVAIVSYFLHTRKNNAVKWMIGLMTLLIFITGHSGGSLTHGSDYLTKSITTPAAKTELKPIGNVQEAVMYKDVVQPILEEKCYSCHNETKQKGKLRLDGPEWISKGGKQGEVVITGNADESELIKRLLLPKQHEDHMPPKEKPQLKEKEIALLHWWINSGLSFDKKVKDLAQTEKIKPLLLSLQSAVNNEIKAKPQIPEAPVEKADAAAIKKLAERGVVVLPVAQNSNYLLANFVTLQNLKEEDIKLLLSVKEQLVWVKFANQPINDAMLSIIAECKAITRLDISYTKITDKGFTYLQELTNLQSLNLVGTAVTTNGLMQLKNNKELQAVYIYQSSVDKKTVVSLKTSLPNVTIDTGGYSVPTLAGDTTVFTKPK